MAASIVLLGSSFNTTSGTHTVTATPQAEDLIVIVTASSGNTSTTAPTDNNGGGGASIGYSLITNALKNTSADQLAIFIRDSFCQTNNSTTFTHAPGTSTGGGLAVYAIRGIGKAGLAAIRQSAVQANHASGSAPAPTFSSAALTTNMIISAVFNATSPAGLTAKSGYTRDVNSGYSTPTSGLNTMHINSGETGTAITWGSSSGSAFSSIAIEIDTTITAIENQIDLFTGSFPDPAKWYDNSQSGGTSSVSNYAVTLTAPASTPGALAEIESQYFYNLTGSNATVKATITQVADVNAEAKLTIYNDEYGNQLQITLRNGNLVCGYFSAGSLTDLASVTYNATSMAWWRIMESGGTIHFQYSSGNYTWSDIGTLSTASSPIDITHARTSVAIYNGVSSGTAEVGVFSNFGFPNLVQFKQATGSSTSASLTLNSTPIQNNLLVAIVFSHSATAITMSSSGWTALTSVVSGAGSVAEAYRMFYKIAGASESTTVTATVGSSNWSIEVIEYNNIDTSTPLNIDNAQSSGSGTISTTFSSPTVTPSGGSGNILIIGGAGLGLNSTTTSNQSVNSSTTGVNTVGPASVSGTQHTTTVWNKWVNSYSGTYNTSVVATGTINYSASGIAIFNIANNNTTTTQTITGTARITASTTKTITGKANILATTTKTITGVSKIVTNATLIASAAGYYAFDDNTGSTVKDSVGTNNGTWQGTLGSQWGTGKINSDGVFNGTDNYVNMGNVLDQTGAFSVSFWFKSSATGASVLQAVSKEQFASPYLGWGIGLNVCTATSGDAGKVGIAGVDNTGAITRRQSTATYNDGNWHHAVITYDNSKTRAGIKIYVDNAEVTYQDFDSSSWTGSWSNSLNFEIGGRDTNNQLFSGQLDEVGIWSRALTTSDIGQLYNNGSGYQPVFATTSTQTITGVARITASTTKTITGKSRIQEAVSKTITGVSRIQESVSETITGLSRIQETVTKTITGKARVQESVSQTITGKSRVQESVSKTITGLSRITASTTKTIQGVANIRNSTNRNITGLARVQESATKTITGLARIQESVNKTITGLARVTALTSKTIQGLSRITASTLQTVTGKAAIRETTTQTITGKARIQEAASQTITGKGRIQESVTQTITGKSRITASTNQTITGKSRIQESATQTISGKASIASGATKTITGLARLQQAVSKTVTGLARITASTTKTITGKSRIQESVNQTISGKANIRESTNKTVQGVARIQETSTQTVTGKARIQESVNKTVTGLSRITASVSKTVTGLSRVTASTNKTISGKAAIRETTTRTIAGLSRIQEVVLKTITGLSRITESTIQTITGKTRITASTLRTITGKSRVTASTNQTIQGISRITASTNKTISGTSRIQESTNQSITGEARITASTNKTITGKTRITASASQTIQGTSRIQESVNQTVTGLASIQTSNASANQTITGTARIHATANRTITGKASILSTVSAKQKIIFIDGNPAINIGGAQYMLI